MNKRVLMASALTLALVVSPLSGMSLGVSAEEGEPVTVASVSGDETGAMQLTAPADLKWGNNYAIQFIGLNESLDGIYGNSYWDIEVYKDGELYDQTGLADSYDGGHSLPYSAHINESGTYKFRVRARAAYEDKAYTDSEWSEWSAERTYVKPERELGVTVAYWDTEKTGEYHYVSVENASGYWTELYCVEPSGELFRLGAFGGYVRDSFRDAGGQLMDRSFAYDISNYWGEGRYCIKVMALSNDIDEIANGPVGPVSDVLDTTANAEKLGNVLESAADRSAAEARDLLAGSAEISAIQMAMQTNDSFRGQIKSLEEKYAAEQGITLKAPLVSAQAQQYVDHGQVQVVGAGLNAAQGSDMGLQLDVTPEANRVPTHNDYQKNVQLDIRLVSNSQEVHELTVPVSVTMPVPQGLRASQLIILHYHEDGTIERTAFHDNGNGTITFTVTGFSTFVFAEESAVDTSGDKQPGNGSGQNAGGSGYMTSLENRIASAVPGTTVKVTRDQNINALSNSVMQQLVRRGDVALEMEYTYEGVDYRILIPAGMAVDDTTPWYGPLYLAAYFSCDSGSDGGVDNGTASVYIVQRGDTLSKIAGAHNTTVARLAVKNPQIKNVNRIMPGQIIVVE